MKGQIWKKLLQKPQLHLFDFFLTLLPLLAWIGAIYARPIFMNLPCAHFPEKCVQENIIWPDRIWLGHEDPQADGLSFYTQNISGFMAVSIPAFMNLALVFLGRIQPMIALAQLGTDLMLILQTVVWNGLINESLRLLIQRPRPFVYLHPLQQGADPAHYTSFYSGHTSFSAAVCMALILILLSRQAPKSLTFVTAVLCALLVVSTGIFRVLSGRHFPTDVLAGALAGSCIAIGVAYLHRFHLGGPALALKKQGND